MVWYSRYEYRIRIHRDRKSALPSGYFFYSVNIAIFTGLIIVNIYRIIHALIKYVMKVLKEMILLFKIKHKHTQTI